MGVTLLRIAPSIILGGDLLWYILARPQYRPIEPVIPEVASNNPQPEEATIPVIGQHEPNDEPLRPVLPQRARMRQIDMTDQLFGTLPLEQEVTAYLNPLSEQMSSNRARLTYRGCTRWHLSELQKLQIEYSQFRREITNGQHPELIGDQLRKMRTRMHHWWKKFAKLEAQIAKEIGQTFPSLESELAKKPRSLPYYIRVKAAPVPVPTQKPRQSPRAIEPSPASGKALDALNNKEIRQLLVDQIVWARQELRRVSASPGHLINGLVDLRQLEETLNRELMQALAQARSVGQRQQIIHRPLNKIAGIIAKARR